MEAGPRPVRSALAIFSDLCAENGDWRTVAAVAEELAEEAKPARSDSRALSYLPRPESHFAADNALAAIKAASTIHLSIIAAMLSREIDRRRAAATQESL